MEQRSLLASAVGVGVGVGLGLASARWAKPAHAAEGSGDAEVEAELRRLVVDGRDSDVTFDEFHHLHCYLSEQTKEVLISAAFVHLKQADLSKHIRNLSAASRAILLSGPTEPYLQSLARTLSHYYKARLLLLDAIDFSLRIQSKYGSSHKAMSLLASAVGVGVGVGLGIASARWAKPAHAAEGSGGAEVEAELRRLMVDGRDSDVPFDEFHHLHCYLSEQTKEVLISAAFVHLKQADLSKHIRNLSAASRAILLSGPTEPYLQSLARALSHYYKARLLVLDVTDFSLRVSGKPSLLLSSALIVSLNFGQAMAATDRDFAPHDTGFNLKDLETVAFYVLGGAVLMMGLIFLYRAYRFLTLEVSLRRISIPFATYPPKGTSYPKGDVHTVCAICISEFKKFDRVAVLPPCGHIFHRRCLREEAVLKSPRCPLCRAALA